MTTRLEACRQWVQSFNAIPQSLIIKAYGGENIDDLNEVTPVTTTDRVWSDEHQQTAEVISIDTEEETAVIRLDDTQEDVTTELNDLSHEYDDCLPMWGTMWMFDDSCDNWWIENNLQLMAECGFRIYEIEEGYIFGIDGAGYDFYEAHWLPLYEARGLRWHDEEE